MESKEKELAEVRTVLCDVDTSNMTPEEKERAKLFVEWKTNLKARAPPAPRPRPRPRPRHAMTGRDATPGRRGTIVPRASSEARPAPPRRVAEGQA